MSGPLRPDDSVDESPEAVTAGDGASEDAAEGGEVSEIEELRAQLEQARQEVAQLKAGPPVEPTPAVDDVDVSPERALLEDRRAQALRDIAELDQQIADGEIDSERAEQLRAVYESEASQAEAAIGTIDESEPKRSWLGRRSLMGVGLMVVGVAVAAFAVTQAVEPRPPGGFATGGVPTDVVTGGATNLDQVTNEDLEAVVADNPEVVGMRLALARRYVEQGDFQAALPHYMTVLEDGPNAEALAYVGWMTHHSGDPEEGAHLVEQALEIDDSYPLALAFLAVIRLDGLDDPAGAQVMLDRLSLNPHLSPAFLQSVEEIQARVTAAQ